MMELFHAYSQFKVGSKGEGKETKLSSWRCKGKIMDVQENGRC
jgi:hypothetical protein